MFQDEPAILQEQVSKVKLHRYNQEYLYLKFNGYGNKGVRRFQEWALLYVYWLSNTRNNV